VAARAGVKPMTLQTKDAALPNATKSHNVMVKLGNVLFIVDMITVEY